MPHNDFAGYTVLGTMPIQLFDEEWQYEGATTWHQGKTVPHGVGQATRVEESEYGNYWKAYNGTWLQGQPHSLDNQPIVFFNVYGFENEQVIGLYDHGTPVGTHTYYVERESNVRTALNLFYDCEGNNTGSNDKNMEFDRVEPEDDGSLFLEDRKLFKPDFSVMDGDVCILNTCADCLRFGDSSISTCP